MTERHRTPIWTLLLLTLVAGVLRFSFLDRPAVWGDESQTWRRISGTYQQLTDELRTAGFMPAHYLLTWWIKEGFPLAGEFKEGPAADPSERDFFVTKRTGPNRLVFTPTYRLIEDGIEPTPMVLRFLPAVCGTLMVPAMYFLASWLVARRTALLVAVFTCFSAYLLNYSRDAKMYMQFWFFATLHVGCLLWWLDVYHKRKPVEQPHIISDEVDAGVHAIFPDANIARMGDAFAVKPDRRKRLIATRQYPTRLETLVRWLCWLVSGMAMIAFNAIGLGILGIELLIFVATIPHREGIHHHAGSIVKGVGRLAGRAFGRRTPVVPIAPPPLPSERFRLFIPPILGFIVCAAAIVLLWWGYKDFTRFYERVNPRDEITKVDLGDAGISWVEDYNEGRDGPSHFLYTATAYLINWEWVKSSQLKDVDPKALTLLRYTSMALLIAIGAGVVPWRQLISKRPANPSILRGPRPLATGFVLAAWLLLPAYGFYCASGAWDKVGDKVSAAAPLPAVLSGVFPAAANDDAHKLAGALGAELTSTRRAKGFANREWGQLFIVRHLQIAGIRWWVLGGLIGVGALMLLNRWYTIREKFRVILRGLGFIAILGLLAMLVYVFTPAQNGSIWMPRYLGFIWPAFAIVVCVLIRRLPFAPLRWLVVTGLITANLGVFYHRCSVGEPRTDLIAADYRIARDSDEIRMFVKNERSRWSGAPGFGSTTSMPAIYYVSLGSKLPMSPSGARSMLTRRLDLDPLPGDFATAMKARLDRDPKAREFYFWIEHPVDEPPVDVVAALHQKLGEGWVPVLKPSLSPDRPFESWTAYDHWTWRRLYLLERHHWMRAATTRPTTRPATRGATQVDLQ